MHECRVVSSGRQQPSWKKWRREGALGCTSWSNRSCETFIDFAGGLLRPIVQRRQDHLTGPGLGHLKCISLERDAAGPRTGGAAVIDCGDLQVVEIRGLARVLALNPA